MGGDTPVVPETPADRLAPSAADRFILLWGEMGTAPLRTITGTATK